MFRGRFPFFGGQQNEVPAPKPVDTQALYNVLGIPKTASPTEIRKSYMSMARKVTAKNTLTRAQAGPCVPTPPLTFL